jgi:hypothetical protein
MADVAVIYAAVISAAAAITGAAVPLRSAARREERVAERARQERERTQQEQRATERQEACVQLLNTVLGLKVRVESNHQYHGPELAERLAEIRRCVVDARVEGLRVALMVPPELADSAERLAEAARCLAETVIAKTSLEIRGSAETPDVHELDKCVDDFMSLTRAMLAGPGAGPARGDAGTAVGRWRRPRAWPVPRRRSRHR